MQLPRTPSFLRHICPECAGTVRNHSWRLGIFKPKFECTACGSALTARPTRKFFVWLAVGLSGIFLLDLGIDTFVAAYNLSPNATHGVTVIVLSIWLALTVHQVFDGMVFGPWRRGGL